MKTRLQLTEAHLVPSSASNVRSSPSTQNLIPSRRSLLRSIGLVMPAAIVGVPVIAAAMPSVVAAAASPAISPPFVVREYAAVLAIGDQIGPLVASYRAADAARLDARAWAEKLSPPIPPELLLPPGHPWRACGDEVRDAEGNRPEPETYLADDGKRYGRMPVKVFNSKITRAYLQEHGLKHEGPRLRRLIARAEKYERQRLSAIQVSGIRAAVDRLEAVRWKINNLAHEAAELNPRTWAGVAIFARLAILPDELGDDVMGWKHAMRVLLTTALARAVLTVRALAQEGVA